ncbi:unnamed protein product [Onchocerca ochengi]|uniref:CSRNP_N domain-containing protein n=1 Tax=Onchocerca ochengi TaxID=42157 RepID=A0A182E9E1_ONCOC|nr:unnamed protein product [Onchocerca ochengi]
MDAQYSICNDNSKNTSDGSDINNNASNNERRKKGVRFENVKIYLFERTQGFDVVPSSGGIALGMQKRHFDIHEVALCNNMTDDDITKSQDCKLSAKDSVEWVGTMPTRRKRGYYNTFDENATAKRLRIGDDTMDQTLSKMKAITNVENGESKISERISSISIPDSVSRHINNIKEENEKDNILTVKKYFRPLGQRTRLLKLKNAGFKKFMKDDQATCDVIRESRKHCGCSCGILPCSPETCECSRNGIECLVDRPSFPCTCTATDCNNIFGRREFDEAVVRSHFYSTLVRTQTS